MGRSYTPLNHVPSNVAIIPSIFANVNLPLLIVYFSSSSKCWYFFLSFEVNFTIFTAIVSEQERAIIAFKKSV